MWDISDQDHYTLNPLVNRRRLIFQKKPDLVLNPHLFEDPNMWPTKSLRSLCVTLKLSPAGCRSVVVNRLIAFHRRKTFANLLSFDDTDLFSTWTKGKFPSFTLPAFQVPAQLRRSVSQGPHSEPAVKQVCRYSLIKTSSQCYDQGDSSKTQSNKRGSLPSPHAITRGRKRSRFHSQLRTAAYDPLERESKRKKLTFCPFNNVQLIHPVESEWSSKSY